MISEQPFALTRGDVTSIQVNLGKICNQACHHCHVAAGPKRTEEMDGPTARRVIELLERSPKAEVLDITGGAPELNPHFRMIVKEARSLGRRVIDRCNLTVLFEPGMEDVALFLAEEEVHIIASLPCYSSANVDAQRGAGVFEKSIRALRTLNRLGYGLPEGKRRLDLLYNPLGPALPPDQVTLEQDYRNALRRDFGIQFDHLLTLANMPIERFKQQLERNGELEPYMKLLTDHYSPDTLESVMCRTLISIGYDGRLYDCDFNQMLELSLGSEKARTIWEIDSFDGFEGEPIVTGRHCFGCTAGAGSSCSGALRIGPLGKK